MIKKTYITLLSFMLSLLLSSFAYADPLNQSANNLSFEVTSGIDTQKGTLTTFDKSRTIIGSAEKGTKISISVYQKVVQREGLRSEVLKEIYSYELTVGPSGYFTQAIDLFVGENIVVIYAEKENKTTSFSTNIKRKKSEIKSELESNIILPSLKK